MFLGRLIHAEVYVTLKVRRASLVQFMEVLVGCFEKEHIGQVSPTYDALLKSELDQQRVTQEMADEHGAAEDDEAETEEA